MICSSEKLMNYCDLDQKKKKRKVIFQDTQTSDNFNFKFI